MWRGLKPLTHAVRALERSGQYAAGVCWSLAHVIGLCTTVAVKLPTTGAYSLGAGVRVNWDTRNLPTEITYRSARSNSQKPWTRFLRYHQFRNTVILALPAPNSTTVTVVLELGL